MDKKRLIAMLAITVILAFSAGWLVNNLGSEEKQPELVIEANSADNPDNTVNPAESQTLLWVYVIGEVERPGVYQLPPNSRVFQAVDLAGAGEQADLSQLDMARALIDGEKIRVPRQGEKLETEPGVGSAAGNNSVNSNGLVNINTASAEEMDRRLPGIGPSLAQRIVDYRQQHKFTKKEDIKNVSGIGDKRYESLKDLITVSP